MSANTNIAKREDDLETAEQGADLPENILVRNAVVEDPIARFLYQKRDAISYLIIAVLASVLGYRWYTESHANQQAASAKVFSGMLDSFAQIETASKEGKTAEQSVLLKFDGEVKTLASQGEPYASLAKVYTGLKAVNDKKFSQAAEELKGINWEKISDGKPENLITELQALYLAKALMAEKDYRGQAEEALKKLAEKGTYAAWPALSTLYALADEDAEKSLTPLKEAFIARNPEQAELAGELE